MRFNAAISFAALVFAAFDVAALFIYDANSALILVDGGGGGGSARTDDQRAASSTSTSSDPVPPAPGWLRCAACWRALQAWSTFDQKLEAEEVMKVINELKPADL